MEKKRKGLPSFTERTDSLGKERGEGNGG